MRIAEIIAKSRAGSPSQLSDEEFKFLVGTWVETVGGVVPEHRLNDTYLHAMRTKDSGFLLTATDMCMAWKQVQEAERAMPTTGSYEWSRARAVCPHCNGTETLLTVRRDSTLGRDYTYGKKCYHEGFAA